MQAIVTHCPPACKLLHFVDLIAVNVEAPVSAPLPLPIVLPPLTVAAPGQRSAPTGLKVQQLGLASWNLDRANQRVA
jgi:hypothetical protein